MTDSQVPSPERHAPNPRQRSSRGISLGRYVKARNGVPLGASGSLKNMLERSLGARSFAVFWRYWNPIWGYFLGRYVFRPARRVLPLALATVFTFVVSGAVHDLVISAVKGKLLFLFTPWFLFMGLGVIASEAAKMDWSAKPWLLRAALNLAYVSLCLALALGSSAALWAWLG